MEGLDTFAAFAATYGSVDDAEADYEAIKSLYYDEHLVDTFDAAVICQGRQGQGQDRQEARAATAPGRLGRRRTRTGDRICASPCSQQSPSGPASCGAPESAPAWGHSPGTRPAG